VTDVTDWCLRKIFTPRGLRRKGQRSGTQSQVIALAILAIARFRAVFGPAIISENIRAYSLAAQCVCELLWPGGGRRPNSWNDHQNQQSDRALFWPSLQPPSSQELWLAPTLERSQLPWCRPIALWRYGSCRDCSPSTTTQSAICCRHRPSSPFGEPLLRTPHIGRKWREVRFKFLGPVVHFVRHLGSSFLAQLGSFWLSAPAPGRPAVARWRR